jgi:predicted nucleotidyltransferase
MAERNDHLNKKIHYFLDETQKKYSVTCAYLYGSFAKGTSNKWSDIDLAIVSPDFSDDLFEDRLFLMRLAATIDDRIEPRLFKEELFNRNDPLVDEIQKNGIQLL